MKGKIVPALAFIAMCLPALVNAFAVARGNQRLFGYDVYVPNAAGRRGHRSSSPRRRPNSSRRDLRSHVLPLYFCRPLRRGDYPLAKYLALTAALLLLIEIPLLILYVGTIASASGGSAIWHETRALIPGLGVGLMWAVLFAAIGLVLASFTGRRAYSTGIVAIACILTFFVSLLLIQAEGGQSATSRRGRGSPGSSARSPSSTGCASGWAAARKRGLSPIQAATGRSTGSWRWSCSRPASGAWPRGTGG